MKCSQITIFLQVKTQMIEKVYLFVRIEPVVIKEGSRCFWTIFKMGGGLGKRGKDLDELNNTIWNKIFFSN